MNAYDDDEESNAHEQYDVCVLLSLQTKRRRASTSDDARPYRALINRYKEEFCVDYRFRPMQAAGNQSNLEAYVGTQMSTAYLNNAEVHSGQHLRTSLLKISSQVLIPTMELLIDGMNWRTLERDLLKPSTSSLLFGTYRKQSLSRRFIVV